MSANQLTAKERNQKLNHLQGIYNIAYDVIESHKKLQGIFAPKTPQLCSINWTWFSWILHKGM